MTELTSEEIKEIEKRCKVRMYFEAQDLLTMAQLIECENIGLQKFPVGDVNTHLRKLCKILTKKQMKKVSASYFQLTWSHKTLFDWYINNRP